MVSVTIQIGNTDNKLTQLEWAHFVEFMKIAIENVVYRVHFFGGSGSFDPWQNACWVVELVDTLIPRLKSEVHRVRKSFGQDSAAFCVGTTEFV